MVSLIVQEKQLFQIISSTVNENPVLKADAIKYVMVFRTQLQRDALISCLPGLIRLLTSETQVVHTYAAHALERIFTVKLEDGPAYVFDLYTVYIVSYFKCKILLIQCDKRNTFNANRTAVD